jgi:Cu(I)/Ag(I) efflux system membrane fusion protein
MALLPAMKASVKAVQQTEDLAQQRSAFMALGEALYQSVKQLGADGPTLYYQYCPMAVGDQGAYWLSKEKEIRNPYFGESMLKCGENKETLLPNNQ